MKKNTVILTLLVFIISSLSVAAQDSCGNDYFSSGTAETPLGSRSVAPSTGADLSTISSTSIPANATPPIVSFGGNNCFDNVIFLGIRWNNDINTGASNRIIVNTPNETLAVVNIDDGESDLVEIRWYDQDGLTPASLVVPELVVDHDTVATHAVHTSISDGFNTGDMVLATRTTDGDIHIGRYRATLSPVVWQTSLDDTLSAIHFIDYNPAADVIGILARTSTDIVIYTINAGTGAVINRVAIDSGAGTADVGHGIRVDSTGNAYISYSAGFPGPYHALKVDTTPVISWKTILAPGNSHDQLADDNLVALVGTNVYVGGNLGAPGAQIFRLSQAAGAADFQLDLLSDTFLAGLVPAVNLATGVYFYGQNETSSRGALGLVGDAGPSKTYFNAYPDFAIIFGVAEGNFFRILAVGQDATFFFGHTAFIGGANGVLDVGFADLIDIQGAGDANDNEFSDVVVRPTAGFFDVFTTVGDNAAGAHTKVVQLDFGNCGDGEFFPGEECDPGNPGHNNASCDLSVAPCDFDCTCPICGDFILHEVLGEECDDGNNVNGDGCSSTCQEEAEPVCGDGILDFGEECDDGNNDDGDGCSAVCTKELKPDFFDTLLGQAIANDLLLDKESFMSHVITEETFQFDLKKIEMIWRESFKKSKCETLPLLLAISKVDYRYGKIEESDALLDMLELILDSSASEYGVSDSIFNNFLNLKFQAESAEESEEMLVAAGAKCCAYNQLLEDSLLTFNPDTGKCEPRQPPPPRGGGGGGGGGSAAGICDQCPDIPDGYYAECCSGWYDSIRTMCDQVRAKLPKAREVNLYGKSAVEKSMQEVAPSAAEPYVFNPGAFPPQCTVQQIAGPAQAFPMFPVPAAQKPSVEEELAEPVAPQAVAPSVQEPNVPRKTALAGRAYEAEQAGLKPVFTILAILLAGVLITWLAIRMQRPKPPAPVIARGKKSR